MKKNVAEIQSIIEDLITSIDQVKEVWNGIRKDNPDFEQVSEDSWTSKEARLWMHGETKTLEAMELERWLFVELPISQTAKSIAMDNYLAWGDHLREDGSYEDFIVHDLPKPQEEETLSDYIINLSRRVEENGWETKEQKLALHSFLHFLREDYHQEDIAFIEHIFPKKMDLRADRIIRKVPQQIYPISHEIAGAIIKELAYQCCSGRENARHHAGEALGLIWLCIATSKIRLPRTLESVHKLGADAIVFKENHAALHVPSIFGTYPVRIGNQVATFLAALANIPSKETRKAILQTSLPDLRKPLKTAIKKVNPPQDLGKITFLTFLSYPHHFGKNIR